MKEAIVVAIDGPAGAGKSTVAKRVAQKTDLVLIDTGAIYRTIALVAVRKSIPYDDAEALAQVAANLPITLQGSRVLLAEEDVSAAIRENEISMAASTTSRHPEVRDELLGLQRKLGRTGRGSVMEGRDIGTVVFPDAELKVFLTATVEERARRRAFELSERGEDLTFAEVLADIERRDKQDKEREVAPLKPAPDAVVLDSTKLSMHEVIETIVGRARPFLPSTRSQ